MKILVYAEVRDGAPSADALGLLAKARALGAEAWAVVCGPGARSQVPELARHGARQILAGDEPMHDVPVLAERIAQAVTQHDIEWVFIGTSVPACDLAGALAARLEAGIAWGLVDIEVRDDQMIGTRPTHFDSRLAEMGWTTQRKIALFRQRAFAPEPAVPTGADEQAIVAPLPASAEPPASRVKVRDAEVTVGHDAADAASLAQAQVVVSAGRGIGKPENLAHVKALAACLNGVTGVSLPLVEMGWASRSMQVGQTGTLVKPRLYIACGISGQIQHRLGMEQSEVIIAINTDAGAPIMGFCDLAVVADFDAVVPPLVDLIRGT